MGEVSPDMATMGQGGSPNPAAVFVIYPVRCPSCGRLLMPNRRLSNSSGNRNARWELRANHQAGGSAVAVVVAGNNAVPFLPV